jgi:hypothetical protein
MSQDDPRKFGLIADLARARREIGQNVQGLSHDVEVKRRLKTAFREHRAGWLAGGGLLGFLLAELPARGKKVVVHRIGRKPDKEGTVLKAGIFMTIVKLAFDVIRPALTTWVTRWVAGYAGRRLRR